MTAWGKGPSLADKIRSQLPPPSSLTSPALTNNNKKSNNNNKTPSTTTRPRRRRLSFTSDTTSPLLLLGVFHFLSARDLSLKCANVCRSWRIIVNEPVCWHFAWAAHQFDIEVGFARNCYDPKDQLLRLAGIATDQEVEEEEKQREEEIRKQQKEQQQSAAAATAIITSRKEEEELPQQEQQHQEQVSWEELDKRGGPGLMTQQEISSILKLSNKKHFDNRYRLISRAGIFRLRYIVSILMHNHELRRDLNFTDRFSNDTTFLKVFQRRKFVNLNRKTAVFTSSSSSSAATATSGGPNQQPRRPEPGEEEEEEQEEENNNNNIEDDENENNNEQEEEENNNEQQQQEAEAEEEERRLDRNRQAQEQRQLQHQAALDKHSKMTLKERKKHYRIRFLTFVSKDQWAWLSESQSSFPSSSSSSSCSSTAIAASNSISNTNNKKEEETNEQQQNQQQQDQEEEEKSLRALATLQALRSATGLSDLTASKVLNSFSYLAVGHSALPSDVNYYVIDCTQCVDLEDDKLLFDINACFFGGERRKRPFRLVELTMPLACGIVRNAVKKNEREAAIEVMSDFALRPLSQYRSPQNIESVSALMRNVSVGRSTVGSSPTLVPVQAPAPPPPPPSLPTPPPSLPPTFSVATGAKEKKQQQQMNSNNNNNNNNFFSRKPNFLNTPTPTPTSSFEAGDDDEDYEDMQGGKEEEEEQRRRLHQGIKGRESAFPLSPQKQKEKQEEEAEEEAEKEGAKEKEIPETSSSSSSSSSSSASPPREVDIVKDELALRECLSLICAPKFFSGPELCAKGVSVLVVDALRIVLIKLKA